MIADIIFCIFIFISVFFTIVNIAKTIYRERIPALNILLMATGLTGVITHIIGIWWKENKHNATRSVHDLDNANLNNTNLGSEIEDTESDKYFLLLRRHNNGR